MNPPLLDFIPFWIQVRGIPLQFLNENVVAHIGRAMGELVDINYYGEAAARVEYVRIRINWDVNRPLRFQRNFQFTPGVNTLLRFRYERLRGFCEVCGMMTHDNGNCLIQNGGPGSDDDSDSDDDDNDGGNNGNPGVHIEEIHGDAVNNGPVVVGVAGPYPVDVVDYPDEMEVMPPMDDEDDATPSF